MIKKVLIAVTTGVVAFAFGLVGIYLAMPHLAPERVVEARVLLDSLAHPEILPAASPEGGGDPSRPPRTGAPDSLTQETLDAAALQAAFADSLRMLRQRLQQSEKARTLLKDRLATMQQEQAAAGARQAEAGALSSTLAKLEDRELQALLAQLDMDILGVIYRESSGRNRARLLQAMAPDRAARFVQDLVQSTPPEASGAEAEPTQQP